MTNAPATDITQGILAWFRANQRPLPWRKEYRPYHVWISEIMGQQTQMERVVSYFQNWISLFPDIPSLAAASEQEVIKVWEGLGYYSRVRNIRKTAEILVQEYGGELPKTEAELLALPGIGPYTAAAILSIAFNQAVPLIDANVERVLCRLDDIDQPVKQAATRKILLQRCSELLHQDDARNFNQALMEFGALNCTPKKPSCTTCPLQQHCQAYLKDIVDLRPVPGKKEQRIDIFMACGIIRQGDRFFIQQRMEKDVWGGLWEFPGGRLKEGENSEQAAVREILEETEFQVSEVRPFATAVHHYTKYRVTLDAFFCTLADQQVTEPVLHAASQYKWVTLKELSHFAFPSGHRQLIEKLR
ncbi:MAG: A/G-specific adenine glycosylase [Candidatus Electrothrix aestuarii]|uniref:Adenine DNA glycosylase n=1 Tax=Candidatus Electrothrix aestuarii TaxID=3062594 RepID=A0AAU8LTB9_9BACT|nr:A/G-specific adenine glycosylase [Candidatus Electrothrix aestuarii]